MIEFVNYLHQGEDIR